MSAPTPTCATICIAWNNYTMHLKREIIRIKSGRFTSKDVAVGSVFYLAELSLVLRPGSITVVKTLSLDAA